MASIDEICAALGEDILQTGTEVDGIARSPGQMLRHYSPRTPLTLTENLSETAATTSASFAVLAIGGDPKISKSVATREIGRAHV